MNLANVLKNWPEWGLGITAEPEVVSTFEQGLTNRSYLLAAGDNRWVLRLNADNSEQLGIDRRVERHILATTAQVGLSPRRHYCNPEAGILISQYLPAWQPEVLGAQQIGQLAAQMRKLHQLDVPGVPAVDYVEYTESYVARLRQVAWTPELASLRERELSHVEAFVAQRSSLPLARLTLCHHDPSPAHWRLQGQSLCLIDWEYAALRDPACDLALLAESWQLSPQQIKRLLAEYGGGITPQRVFAAQRVCQYVNQLWYALQTTQSKSS